MINDAEYEIQFRPGTRLWTYDAEIDTFGGNEVSWSDVDWSDEADLERWEELYEHDIDKREFNKTFPIGDWRKA